MPQLPNICQFDGLIKSDESFLYKSGLKLKINIIMFIYNFVINIALN